MFRKRTVSAVALTTGDHEDEYEHLGNKYTKNSVKRDQPTDKLDDMGVIRGGFADALHERGDEVKRHQSRDNEGSPEGSSSQDHVSEEGQGKGPGVFMALGSSESSEKTELSVSDPEGIGRICSVDKGVNSDDDWSNADNRSNISSDGSVHIGLRDPEPTSLSATAIVHGPLAGPLLTTCITACGETPEELQYCLATFHGECPADLNLDAIYVILDGCPDEDMQTDNLTFQALATIMDLNVTTGGASVLHEGGCRVYLGKLGSVPARLYVKGRGELQRSKRRSIMAFYDILGQRIASGRSEEPLAVLHMDADTGSAEPGGDNSKTSFGLENVAKLLRIMQANENLGGLATQVRVLHRTKNALGLMQSFDCNTTYVGLNGGTSLAGRSTACLGMTVMYRFRALHVSTVKGVLAPISAFSRAADRNIVDHVNLDMNEDQGMTTFIMRAGYETKTSLVTHFSTFAPENLAELLGQRRRWQAGFFVGVPYQLFSTPSPYFQLSKLRWLVACLIMMLYINMLLMPGTLGYLLAFMFEQASVGLIALWQALFGGLNVDWAECDRRYRVVDLEGGEVVADGGGQEDAAGCVGSEALANEYTGGLLLQVVFASCIWMFWIAFIASTLGHAPKKIRVRCQFFFTTACVVTAAVLVAAAAVSRAGKAFLGVLIVWNALVGLSLTYDVREWPHRLQEVLFYCIYMCAIMPMITMYAVANIDSALWGTRSIGEVKNASAEPIVGTNTTLTDKGNNLTLSRGSDSEGGVVGVRILTFTRGPRGAVRAVHTPAEVVPLVHGSDVFVDYGSSGKRVAEQPETEARRAGKGKEGGGGGGRKNRGLSLRVWKFVILAWWVIVNIGLTASYLQWRLSLLAAVGFFSQSAGLVFFVVAAWFEMRLQRSSALPPSPP